MGKTHASARACRLPGSGQTPIQEDDVLAHPCKMLGTGKADNAGSDDHHVCSVVHLAGTFLSTVALPIVSFSLY